MIKIFSSLDAEGIPPPYNLEESKGHKGMELERHWQVAWVDEDEIEKNPSIKGQMIPVCRPEDSDDGMQWYIARVSYFVSCQHSAQVGVTYSGSLKLIGRLSWVQQRLL